MEGKKARNKNFNLKSHKYKITAPIYIGAVILIKLIKTLTGVLINDTFIGNTIPINVKI